MDIHWRGLFPAIQEAPHVMRTGTLRKILDAQRFAQCGSWEGTISIDGTDLAVDAGQVDRLPRPVVGHPPLR